VTTARREQAKALFTELKSLLREIQETEAAGLVKDAPGGTGLRPSWDPCTHSESSALPAPSSTRAPPTSSAGKKHSGVPRRNAPDVTAVTRPRRVRRVR
jgi:hypothetical protein